MAPFRASTFLLTLVFWLVALAAGSAPGATERPAKPEAGRPGIVFLFPGFTLHGQAADSASGTREIMERVRARGIHAGIYHPEAWAEVAAQFLAKNPHAERLAIAVIGYSYGARSAIELARALGKAGVPVQTLVVIESSDPTPVPGNVARALNLYVAEGWFSKRIVPAPDFRGSLENVRIADRIPGGDKLDHWSVSWTAAVQEMVLSEVLDATGVRWRRGPERGS